MSVPTFIKKRQSALLYTAGTVTSVYFASKWALRKFTQALTSQSRSASAQQQLKKRFQMAVTDTEFTILGLLPVLEESVWSCTDLFDVEGYSKRLKLLNEHLKREKERTLADSTAALLQQSTEALPPKPQSTSPSLNSLNANAPVFVPRSPTLPSVADATATTAPATVSDAATANASDATTGTASQSAPTDTPSYAQVATTAPPAAAAEETAIVSTAAAIEEPEKEAFQETMSRAELWHEIKITTLTRFVTFLHTVSLLSLLSTIQLSLLSRKAYVDSFAPNTADDGSTTNEKGSMRHPSVFDTSFPQEGQFEDEDLEKFLYEQQRHDDGHISSETERAFLTMSWFVMNIGWRRAAADIRERVEEHFASTSLKTVFSSDSLFTMMMQCLPPPRPRDALPSTADEERETLEAGGMSSGLVTPPLRRLLDETDDLLSSTDCETVLRSLQECVMRKMLSPQSQSQGAEGYALARWLPIVSSRSQIERSQALDCLKTGVFRDWAVLVYASWSDDQFE